MTYYQFNAVSFDYKW